MVRTFSYLFRSKVTSKSLGFGYKARVIDPEVIKKAAAEEGE